MKTFIITCVALAITLSFALFLGKRRHTYTPATNEMLSTFTLYLTKDGCDLGEQWCQEFERCFSNGIRSRYTSNEFYILSQGVDDDTVCDLHDTIVDLGVSCSVNSTDSDFYETNEMTADDLRYVMDYGMRDIIGFYCDDNLEAQSLISNLCECRASRGLY